MTPKFINTTPHEIKFVKVVGDGTYEDILTLAPSGVSVRCSSSTEEVSTMGPLAVTKTTYGEVVGLPEVEEGVVYIVSAIVAKAVAGTRTDCFVVNGTVRDSEGRIVGATSLGIVD